MVESLEDRNSNIESGNTWNAEKQETNLEVKKATTEKESCTLSPDAIKWIDFWYIYIQPKNEKLISKLNQDAKWNDSIEWHLAQNEQIQLLLSELLSDYKKYIWTDKEKLKLLINQEKALIGKNWLQGNEQQSKMIESIYEYMLENDNELWFENFIMENSINSIKVYLSNHMGENWKILYISKNEIKARLKIDWFINLYKNYKQDYAEDSNVLVKLESEISQLKDVFCFVKNSIDQWIQQYLRWEFGKKDLAKYLSGFFEIAKKNENLKNFLDGKDENSIIWLIRYGIKEYARLLNISDGSHQLKETWDKVFDMQIRSYLYLYWIIAYEKNNQSNWLDWIIFDPNKWLDDKELWEILKAILITDWIIKDDWNNKYLASEQNVRKIQIIEWWKKRSEARTRINSMKNTNHQFEWQWIVQEKNDSLDIQNATWVEIAQDKDLWSKISENFDRKKSLNKPVNPLLQRNILMKSWRELAKENQEILSKYFDVKEIQQFFVLQNNILSFKNDIWESYKTKWISKHPEKNVSELDAIKNILLRLPGKYEENMKKLWGFINEKKDHAHEIIKNYALGAVIDNVKDMFQNIVNTNNTWIFLGGFRFDENNSARIENDCLFLSGKFNWESMNIKYDLKTWKIYMNSFINESSTMITVSSSNEPIFELWKLESFDNILEQFYKSPTESINTNIISRASIQPISKKNETIQWWNHQKIQSTRPQRMRKLSDMRDKIKLEHKLKFQRMCWTKLDDIWWKVKNRVEAKSIREPIALNLLRTLGVMPEDNWTKNLVWWNNPSDLYKIVQLIISNKNTLEDINKFWDYMKTLFDYIWLRWWEKADHQDKTRDIAKIIFDENNKQDYIRYIRDNTKDFDTEYNLAGGKAQFSEGTNFWVLKIIAKYFTDGEDYPNRKLDYNNIDSFKRCLINDIEDAKDKNEAEKRLEDEIERA